MIYNGSACAIDLEEFDPAKWRQSGEQLKSELGIPKDGIVVGLFCRLTGDKGVNEMMAAFQRISQERPNVYLLVVGREEQKDRLPSGTMDIINNHPRVFRLGWQETLLLCYAALDIFCLPSYREGFPQSLIEAQAMEVAVVTTNIIGARETIVNNQTGLLAEPKNSRALYTVLEKLLDSSQLRKEFAKNGRERVIKMFGRKEFLQAMVAHHLNLLKNAKH
jgi:glycosyltransferase involved in cell wall biosynthesis